MLIKAIRSTFYLLALIVTFLILLELFMAIGFFRPSFEMNGLELHLSRKILFMVKPNTREDINSLGYRDREFHCKKNNKRVLFFGDSFVMGLNVKSDQTMPKFLEKRLGLDYEVYNMGIHGYGPDQSLIDYEEKRAKLDSDFVILSIFPTNDFEDLDENRLFSVDRSGELKINKQNIVNERKPKLNFIYLAHYILYKYGVLSEETKIVENYRLLFQDLLWDNYDLSFITDIGSDISKHKIKLMIAVLSKFKKLMDNDGKKFFILIIPSYENIHDDSFFKSKNISVDRYFVNELIMQSLCEQIGIPYINLYPIFLKSNEIHLLYDKDDHHLSSIGNKVVADTIVNFMSEKNYISAKHNAGN